MPGRSFTAQTSYRYGFNGKEKDLETTETTTYDYGFRIYNPGLGRFLSVDPLTPKYPYYTPYQFSGNKPIRCIDIDGLEPKSRIEYWKKSKGYHNYGNYFNDLSTENQQFELVENYFIFSRESSKNQSREYFYCKIGGDMYQKFDPNNVEKEKPILTKIDIKNSLSIADGTSCHGNDVAKVKQNQKTGVRDDWWYKQKFGFVLDGGNGTEDYYGNDGVPNKEHLSLNGILSLSGSFKSALNHDVIQFSKSKLVENILKRVTNGNEYLKTMYNDANETFDDYKNSKKSNSSVNSKPSPIHINNVPGGFLIWEKFDPKTGDGRAGSAGKKADTTIFSKNDITPDTILHRIFLMPINKPTKKIN